MKNFQFKSITLVFIFLISSVSFSVSQESFETPLIELIGKPIKSKDVKPFLKQLKKHGYKKNKNEESVTYARKSGSYFKFFLKSDVIEYVTFDQNFTLFDSVKTAYLYEFKNKPQGTLFRSDIRNLNNAWLFPNGMCVIASFYNVHASMADIKNRVFQNYTFGKSEYLKTFYVIKKTQEMVLNEFNWASFILHDRIIQKGERPLKSVPRLVQVIGNFDSNSIECIEGDCSSGTAEKIRYSFPENGISMSYEGPILNNYAHGNGKLIFRPLDDDEFVLTGQFNKGALVGKGIAVNKENTDSMTIILNEFGQPIEIERYFTKNSKKYIIRWSPKNNHLYDLTSADVSNLPGEMEILVLNPNKKNGYDYKLLTYGYLSSFCLHNFDAIDGSPLYSEILDSNGKDYFGKYYIDGASLRYQDGKYQPDDGASYIKTNCN